MNKMSEARLKEIKITNQILAITVVILALSLGLVVGKQNAWIKNQPEEVIPQRQLSEESVLVTPTKIMTDKPLNQLIASRRSNQQIQAIPIKADQLAVILWSMQGITASWGERAIPTIRAAYPLTLSVLVRNVEGLSSGLYIFDPPSQSLIKATSFDEVEAQKDLADSVSLNQAPVIIAISGSQAKLKNKMAGIEKNELLYFEAGHAVQNAHLEAESMNLSISPIIQWEESWKNALKLPEDELLITLLAVGYPVAQ